MSGDVAARRKQLQEWELDNAAQEYGAVTELRAEVEKLRAAIAAIKRRAETGLSQTSVPSDERMMSVARKRFANILSIIDRIEKP